MHMSHLATSSPLEKKRSRGFQPGSTAFDGEALPALVLPPIGLFAPGLSSVNRCNWGAWRIVEPPSVARAEEGAMEEPAVRYDSIEIKDPPLYISEREGCDVTGSTSTAAGAGCAGSGD